jgi:hypothetical protein
VSTHLLAKCIYLFHYALLQDYPFSLDEGTGRLALQFDAAAQRVSPEDIKSIQREEVAPWLIALPVLFDKKVRKC